MFDVFLDGESASRLKRQMNTGQLRLPQYSALRAAHIKVDMLSMLWQRHILQGHSIVS